MLLSILERNRLRLRIGHAEETMVHKRDSWGATRRTLIERLKNWQDNESWEDFFHTYGRLIYGVAIKSGLTDAEAQDVVQETVLTVSKNIREFEYDPARGRFKSW